jgi:hypothetical protein
MFACVDRKSSVEQNAQESPGQMSVASNGVSARISGSDVFIQNGRNGEWDLEGNGFTLLTGQPFALTPDVMEEHPSVFGKAIIFHIGSSGVEILGADEVEPERRPFLHYYEDIAKAAKEAYPQAEYVVIPGHITFDADVSRMAQITTLLGGALKAGAINMLAKIFPSMKAENSAVTKLPKFGALKDDALHVDISAEDGAQRLRSSLNDAEPIKGSRLELPDTILSGPGKERRFVSCNFWRNARQDASIKTQHLTVMDTQCVAEEEMAQTKFKNYAIGGQEQHMMWKIKDHHKLVYFPDMTHDEILVFKQGEYRLRRASPASEYEVAVPADEHLNRVFHTAFSDASAPKDAVPRRSIVCAGVSIIMQEEDVCPPASRL